MRISEEDAQWLRTKFDHGIETLDDMISRRGEPGTVSMNAYEAMVYGMLLELIDIADHLGVMDRRTSVDALSRYSGQMPTDVSELGDSD